MRVVRILGTLEPGGAQLSALRLSVALRRYRVATTLLAGDATPPGSGACRPLRPARRGLPGQRGPGPGQPAVGAWWAAARALPPHVPLVASEHNQMSWPGGDHTPQARDAARRVGLFFAHGPAVRAWQRG